MRDGTRTARLLVARNLRAAERTRGLFWLRAAIVVAVILALWWGHTMRALTGGPGGVLLGSVVAIDYWALVLAGITLFPALIAEEHEQGTLSLLRLAGFRPLGFLLGQTLSAFVACLLVLAVQAPFLLLSVTLGGTSTRQVALALLILFLHAIAVYGVALFAGAVRPTSRGATRLALLLVPLVTFVPGWAEDFGATLPLLGTHLARPLLARLEVDALPPEALAAGAALHLGIAGIAALGAWLRFGHGDESAPERRAQASTTRLARPRFPAGPRAFEALTAWTVLGGMPMAGVVVGMHAGLAVIALLSGRGSVAGSLGFLVGLQCLGMLVHAAILGARCTSTVRRERVAGLLLLAGGAHQWLARQRRLRLGVLGVHLLALLLTFVALSIAMGSAGPGGAMLVALGWVPCAAFFADRFGEYCGVAVARGTVAVTLLGGAAVVLLSTSCAAATVAMSGPPFCGFLIVGGGLMLLLGGFAGALTVGRLPGLYAA